MRISVIVAILNGMPHIKETMSNLIDQSLEDFEIIAVDSGSTDGTVEFLKSCMAKDSRIRYIHSEKRSTGYQYNIGFRQARGEYVVFYCQDDLLERDALRIWSDTALAHPELDCVRSDVEFFTESKYGRLGIHRGFLHGTAKSLYGQIINIPASPFPFRTDFFYMNGIFKKSFLEQHNILFNETPGAAGQDEGFMMQILLYAKTIMYLPLTLFHYRTRIELKEAGRNFVDEGEFLLGIMENYSGCIYPYLQIVLGNMIDPLHYHIGRDISCFGSISYQQQLQDFRNHAIQYITALPENQRFLLESDPYINLFMQSLEAFQQSSLISYRPLAQKFYALYKLIVQSECAVVVGTGHQEENLCVLLRNNDYDGHILLCDDNVAEEGMELWGLHCAPVPKVAKENTDALYLIPDADNVNAKLLRLLELGVDETRIVVTPRLGVSEAFWTNLQDYERFVDKR